jgi:hypothetical protein
VFLAKLALGTPAQISSRCHEVASIDASHVPHPKIFSCKKNPCGREFVRSMYRIIQRLYNCGTHTILPLPWPCMPLPHFPETLPSLSRLLTLNVLCERLHLRSINSTLSKIKLLSKHPGGREFVRSIYQIIQRFALLRGLCDSVTPLAIYAAPTPYGAVVKFITAVDVERAMRQTASKVYKLDPITDRDALQR